MSRRRPIGHEGGRTQGGSASGTRTSWPLIGSRCARTSAGHFLQALEFADVDERGCGVSHSETLHRPVHENVGLSIDAGPSGGSQMFMTTTVGS